MSMYTTPLVSRRRRTGSTSVPPCSSTWRASARPSGQVCSVHGHGLWTVVHSMDSVHDGQFLSCPCMDNKLSMHGHCPYGQCPYVCCAKRKIFKGHYSSEAGHRVHYFVGPSLTTSPDRSVKQKYSSRIELCKPNPKKSQY